MNLEEELVLEKSSQERVFDKKNLLGGTRKLWMYQGISTCAPCRLGRCGAWSESVQAAKSRREYQ